MSDTREKLQHALEAAQRVLAEAEARCARHDAEHQAAATNELGETCKKIEQAHHEWASALDVMRDPVFIHDKDFRIQRCNKAYQQRAGISFKQIIGQPYYEIFPKIHAPLPGCLRALKKAEAGAEEEEDVRVGDTSFRSRSFTIHDEQGDYLYSVHILEDITERKKAEAIRTRLIEHIESSPDFVGFADARDNRILYMNRAGRAMTGLGENEDVTKIKIAEVLPAWVNRLLEEVALPAAVRMGSWQGECALQHRDGHEIPVSMNVIAHQSSSGAVEVFSTISRDITERKLTEEKLKTSEAQYREMIELNPLMCFELDQDGVILQINREAARQLGFTIEELVGQPVTVVFHEDQHEAVRRQLATCIRESDREHKWEITKKRKDGSLLWVSETAISIQKGKQKPTLLIMCENISERKHNETQTQQLGQLLQNSFNEIYLFDAHTLHFLQASKGAQKNLGYSADELKQLTPLDLKPEFTSERFETLIAPLRSGEQPSLSFDTVHRRKDGTTYPVEIRLQLVQTYSPVFIAIAQDITERKKSEIELFRLNRIFKTLSECNRTLLRASDEMELMKNICEVITASGGYVLVWIGLVRQDENKRIEAVSIAGEGKAYVEALRLTWDDQPNGRGPSGTAARTGQTQIVQDLQNDPRFEPWREAAKKYGYASSIVLPMKKNGVIFGVLNIYASETSAFGHDEVALLEEVANDLTFGIVNLHTRIERDQAVNERQHYIERLRASLEEALQAIATTVEMRDPYTAGHQRRVAHLAVAIAQKLGLAEEQVHGIHLAGIVHDLGKIRVPAEILSKPGRLDEIEFSFIKTHSRVGFDILKAIQFPWPIAQAVLQHHERLDGSGYPQGLKGDAIIIEARILAVADVVEAMSSHRPYRAGLGIEPALAEINSKRGIEFDPQVVDACLVLFHEQHYSFKE